MALKQFNPTSPGQRGLVLIDRSELHKGRPEKKLVEGLTKSGGRGGNGRIAVRFRGGGAKRLLHRAVLGPKRFELGRGGAVIGGQLGDLGCERGLLRHKLGLCLDHQLAERLGLGHPLRMRHPQLGELGVCRGLGLGELGRRPQRVAERGIELGKLGVGRSLGVHAVEHDKCEDPRGRLGGRWDVRLRCCWCWHDSAMLIRSG